MSEDVKPYRTGEMPDNLISLNWDRLHATVDALESARRTIAAQDERLAALEAWNDAHAEDAVKLEKAEAAAAEMRAALETFHWNMGTEGSFLFQKRRTEALSSDVGRGWASPEQVREIAAEVAEAVHVRNKGLGDLDRNDVIARVLGGKS